MVNCVKSIDYSINHLTHYSKKIIWSSNTIRKLNFEN
ncbi:hypothetical protein Leryth_026959 [Lithospermum erythrorhizon]|nr:hypothetical protein Leryth_026959 [Lithospermum erythrorhizon]